MAILHTALAFTWTLTVVTVNRYVTSHSFPYQPAATVYIRGQVSGHEVAIGAPRA